MAVIEKSLNYKISVDLGDFQRGMRESANELKRAERAMLDTAGPAAKLEARINAVRKAQEEGKISAEQAAEAEKKLQDQFSRTAEIERQTAALERLKKTRGELFAERMGKLPLLGHLAGDAGKAVDLFGGGMAPAAAAAAVAGAGKWALNKFREEAEKIDNVAKSARSVGFSTEGQITLNAAAKRYDQDPEAVTQAVARMNRAIGQAKFGGTEKGAFAALRLDVEELGKLKPEEAFLKISDALRNMTDPYQRAEMAAEIFGKESHKLNEVLRMGRDEFEKLKQTLDNKGKLFSFGDAEQVEAANKAIGRLGETMSVVAQKATIAFSPEVGSFFTSLSSALTPDKTASIWDRMLGGARSAAKASMYGGGIGSIFDPLLGNPDMKIPEEPPADASVEAENLKAERKAAEDAAKEQARAEEHAAAVRNNARTGLLATIQALRMQTGEQHLSAEAARIWAEAQKAGNLELGQQALGLLRQKELQTAAAAAQKKAADETRRLREEMQFANLPAEKRNIELERYRAIRDGVDRQTADGLANLKQETIARAEAARIIEQSQGPAENLAERLAKIDQARGFLSGKQFADAQQKARDEFKKAMLSGLDAKQLQTPGEEYAAELRKIEAALIAHVLTVQQAARLKAAAFERFAEGGKSPTAVEAVAPGSMDALLLGKESAQQEAARQQADRIQAAEEQRRQVEADQAREAERVAALERGRQQAIASGGYDPMLGADLSEGLAEIAQNTRVMAEREPVQVAVGGM